MNLPGALKRAVGSLRNASIFRLQFPVYRLFLFLVILPTAAVAADIAKVVEVSKELRVSIEDDEEVFLSARPLPGEALDAFARRFTEDPATKKEILAGNGGMNLLRRDVFLRVPYRLLSDNYRRIAMEALFPQDHGDAREWTHLVTSPAGHPESLWRIAEWFTGDGSNYRSIREETRIASLPTEAGQVVRIPSRLLLPAFRVAAAASAPEAPLEYGRDEKGRFAVYRLKKGEAL